MKSYLVPDNELVLMLEAKDFEKVEKFPRKLNENIVLARLSDVSSFTPKRYSLLIFSTLIAISRSISVP